MNPSSILVITAAVVATFRAVAVPEAPAELTFHVGRGASLCSFQQCQCARMGLSRMKISCDCTSQVHVRRAGVD